MTPELKAYQLHAKTLIDILEQVKLLASDCDVEEMLGTARDGLTSIIQAIEPHNELALAMIEDTVNIDCEIDQSEFLGNVAAAIFNTINNKLEFTNSQLEIAVTN